MMFEQRKLNRHERRKMAALRVKSNRKKTKGAFGLPIFHEAAFGEETNYEQHQRVQKAKDQK